MPLTDYTVPNDHFEPYLDGCVVAFAFPCCLCAHRQRRDTDEPCRTCGHNATAVDPEETGDG